MNATETPLLLTRSPHPRRPAWPQPGTRLFRDHDYGAYLDWLTEAAARYECAIHAYVLMTNHVHILVTPREPEAVSRMMQYVGRRYVPYINDTYGTSGSLWEGRYKASLIHDEQYLLTCMRYIELNPVRARDRSGSEPLKRLKRRSGGTPGNTQRHGGWHRSRQQPVQEKY